jgi:8-oxo-dGTP diphosphatase
MRIRAGAVLIEDDKVALIERFRNGKHYFVFPGGGADNGETPEDAAIREMEEETGLRVTIICKLVEIHFGLSTQHYFYVERRAGEFGTGTGEEYTEADPDDPAQGVYIPVWMPLSELPGHDNVYPAEVAELVARSVEGGWPTEPIQVVESPR